VWSTNPKPQARIDKRIVVTRVVTPRPAGVEAAIPPVVERTSRMAIEAEGIVAYDAHLTSNIYAPVYGWVGKFAANRRVKPGDVLGSMYSVDVYVAAIGLVEQTRAFQSQAALDNARRRLQRWGLPKRTTDRIEKTGTPIAVLPFVAPRAGTVVVKPAIPGMFVDPGTELFTITDPTRVWVLADVPTADAASISVGTAAKLRIGERSLTAKVAHIYQTYDADTRKLRFEIFDPTASIKPGTAATVEIKLSRQ